MVDKSSLMIDLDDPRAGKIAEVISNKTAKKILGVLAEKELSESEISDLLNLKMNTVGYNIKKLKEAGLIEVVGGFLWSVKGKRIHKYKVSNRKIVISPRMRSGILPAIIGSVFIAGLIKVFVGGSVPVLQDVATRNDMLTEGVSAGAEVFSDEMQTFAPEIANNISSVALAIPEVWAWYLLGSLTALLIFFVWSWRNK